MLKKFRLYLIFAFCLTVVFAAIYAVVQYDIRSSANDPQIEIAENLTNGLNEGKKPQSLVSKENLDISKSLSTFAIIYDQSGSPIASSATLDGNIPTPPKGVFDYTATHKEDRITWQPRKDVRFAIVVRAFSGKESNGYLLVGRSLREIELRETRLEYMLGAGWILSMIASLVAIILIV